MATTSLRGHALGTPSQIRAASIDTTDLSATAGITDGQLATSYIKTDGTRAFTGDQSMGSHKLTNVTDPSSAQDAATKAYVDAARIGLQVKTPVEGATTAALNTYVPAGAGIGATLTLDGVGSFNSEAVDGVTFVNTDRVLIKNETAGNRKYNGIYVVTDVGSGGTPWVLTRATDFDEPTEVAEGSYTLVIEGTTLKGSGWIQTEDITTVDTDNMIFEQFSGSSVYTAGNGIDITSFVVSVKLNGANDYPNSGLNNGGSGLKLADLTDGHILVGNGSNRPADVAMSSDATISNTGAVTVLNQVRITKYIVRETPSGTINGSNRVFTLANTPVSGTEEVFLNGLLSDAGGGNDYQIATNTITFEVGSAPIAGDKIRVTYISS